jgi:hypothetical protein
MNQLPEIPKLPTPEELRRAAKPWDLLNDDIGRVSDEVAESRMSICLSCPFLFKISKQCRKCGCMMNLKTKLPNASCPEGHWGNAPKVSE